MRGTSALGNVPTRQALRVHKVMACALFPPGVLENFQEQLNGSSGQSLDVSPFTWGIGFVLLQGLTTEMELCPGTYTYF